MKTNITILNSKNNRMTKRQGELFTMMLKKRNRKHSRKTDMRKQESDYVRFNLDVLNSLL